MAYDLGQTTICMALAATDLGVGSAHAAVRDQDLARDLLGLPDARELVYLLALGYPADWALEPIREPDRRPFDDVVHRDRAVLPLDTCAKRARADSSRRTCLRY